MYGKAWFYALKHHSIVDGSKVFHCLVVSLQKFGGFREKKVDEVQKSGATHQKSGALTKSLGLLARSPEPLAKMSLLLQRILQTRTATTTKRLLRTMKALQLLCSKSP